jgi:hypothetical protein
LTEFVKENSEKVLAFIAIFSGPFAIIISIVKELHDNWGAIVEAFRTDGIIAGFKKLGGVIISAVLAPVQGLLETLAHIPGVGKLLNPAVDKIKEFRAQLKGTELESTVVQNVVPGKTVNPVPETLTQTVNTAPGIQQGNTDRTIQTVTAASPRGRATNRNRNRTATTTALTPAPAMASYGVTTAQSPVVPPVTVPLVAGKIEGLDEQLKDITADVTVIQNVVPGKIDTIAPAGIQQPTRATTAAAPAIPTYGVNNRNSQAITTAAAAPTPPMTTAEQYYYSQQTTREQVDVNIKTEPGTSAQVQRRPRSPNVQVATSGGNNAR